MKDVSDFILTCEDDYAQIVDYFNRNNYWGIIASMDIHDCDPKLIRDENMIKLFVEELCDKIEMTRFGKCQVVHFGKDKKVEGYSFTQLIETSSIVGHFANETNRAYIDVFSCKIFNARDAAEFAKDFFEGNKVFVNVCLRE